MRVTKVIREYIESQINEKFSPAIQQANNRYDELTKPAMDEVKEILDEANERAKRVLIDGGFNVNDHKSVFSIAMYGIKNEEADIERNLKISELRSKKSNAINDIILRLELGEATKNELKDLIAAVTVD